MASGRSTLIGVDSGKETIQWIWEEGFVVVASDTPTSEAWPCPKKSWHLHEWLLAGWGMPIGELFDLEKIALECQQKTEVALLISGMPLRLSEVELIYHFMCLLDANDMNRLQVEFLVPRMGSQFSDRSNFLI